MPGGTSPPAHRYVARTPPAHAHRTCAANVLLHADILSTTVLELYIVNDMARVSVRARRRAAAADNPDARQADITNGESYTFSVNGNDTEATAGEPGAPPRGPREQCHGQCDK